MRTRLGHLGPADGAQTTVGTARVAVATLSLVQAGMATTTAATAAAVMAKIRPSSFRQTSVSQAHVLETSPRWNRRTQLSRMWGSRDRLRDHALRRQCVCHL